MTIRRAQAQFLNVSFGSPEVVGNPCPHPDHLGTTLYLCGHRAAQVVRNHLCDGIRIDAFKTRFYAIHLDIQSVTGKYNAGLHIDDTGYFCDCRSYSWSKS